MRGANNSWQDRRIVWRCKAWLAVFILPLAAIAQPKAPPRALPPATPSASTAEPTEFLTEPKLLAARVRFAWCSSLSHDGIWMATGYGGWGSVGEVCVRDVRTGKMLWRAREERGVRTVAVSPDDSLVVSGNFAGQVTLRDSATGQVKSQFRERSGSVERLTFSSNGRRIATSSNGNSVRIWNAADGKILNTFTGHTGGVSWVEFSGDDRLLVSASQDRSVRVWDAQDGSLKHLLTHPAEVSAAIFLPAREQIATACNDGMVRVFDAQTGKLVRTMAAPPGRSSGGAYAVAASRDGKSLAASSDASIQMWETATGEHQATLEGHEGAVFGLAWSRDGRELVSSGFDTVVRVWDVAGRKARQVLDLPAQEHDTAGPVQALAVTADGQLMATAEELGTIHLREAASGKLVRKLASPGADVLALAFSPDGQTLAAGSRDGSMRLWDARRGELRATLMDDNGEIAAIAWSPDGALVAAACGNKTVRIWKPATGKVVAVLEGHTDNVLAVAFAPDGRLVSGSGDATALVWDVEKRAVVGTLAGHAGAVRAVAVAPNGAIIVTAGDDTAVRLWDAATFKPLGALRSHQRPVNGLAFSPQGLTLASGAVGGGVVLWDPIARQQRLRLNGNTNNVTGLAFLPDGGGLVSASLDETLRRWPTAAPAIPALLSRPAHGAQAFAVKFSADGKTLATAGQDQMIALRDPMTGEVLETLAGHTALIYDVVFSPDGKRLASAGADGTVRLWSVEEAAQLAVYSGFGKRFANVKAVAFSPDGKEIASGALDGTIKLWNVAERKTRYTLTPQALPVLSVQYSPDGALLATSTGNSQQQQQPGELRLWDVKTGKEVAQLEGHASEIKRVAFDAPGQRLVSASSDRAVRVWNVADRSLLFAFRAEAAVTSVTFLKDPGLVAMGDARGGVAIYNVDNGTVAQRYTGHGKVVPGIAVRPDGQVLATAAHDGTMKFWPLMNVMTSPASSPDK